jgi:deoxyribodipyrimidine photolyase-related protein
MSKRGVLRFVLGDQLSHSLASLRDIKPATDTVLMVEVKAETTYVRHHPQKIILILAAMRHFAAELTAKGVNVRYIKLDDPENSGSFRGELCRAVEALNPAQVLATHPGEWRVWEDMQGWQAACGVPVEIRADDRFLCTPSEFAAHAKGRKELRMEYFYREMRLRHGLLLEPDGKPIGGQWNFDKENRKSPQAGLTPPPRFEVKPDKVTQEVIALVKQHFPNHFGRAEPFAYAITRAQALKALQNFITHALPLFGDYQDAMITGQPWLWHSILSPYLNIGLLLPLEVCHAAEQAHLDGHVPLNAVEGFIRQILGWREYVRGIYWLKMPEYASLNFFKAKRPLPDFYWDAALTELNCIKQCVQQTHDYAYAHHIQRLMVLGNFALLAGLDPKQVNEWYLIVYLDAFEWVELPNVHGMILFADGGQLASKPYAASGKYINRMSDYCKGCKFDPELSEGPRACPFNALYWNFLEENRALLAKNHRLRMMYASLDKMAPDKRDALMRQAGAFLKTLKPMDWSAT